MKGQQNRHVVQSMGVLGAILFLFFTQLIHAFSWRDLWLTKDQQAKVMMDKGQYKQAKDTFVRDDWRAASTYRAGDYEHAAQLFKSLNQSDAYYNEGNALAHMGQYEQAIKAYDKTLTQDPKHQDALFNRQLLEQLLKKEKEKQKNQDKQNQDKQSQDKQDQDKQDQDKQDQDKQDQDKQDQDKQDQDKQDQDKQDQDKQDQDKQDQDKQDQDKQDQDKQNQKDQKKPTEDAPANDEESRENQQAKDQWLRLIPDDPGGLLREKFLRDHLRRQHGWDS